MKKAMMFLPLNRYFASAYPAIDERKRNLPVNAELAGAVDARGFQQAGRHADHGLAEQEDAEHRDGAGDDQGEIGVHPAELVDHLEERRQEEHGGEHHGTDHEEGDDVSASEPVLRERIAGHRRQEDVDGGDGAGQEVE